MNHSLSSSQPSGPSQSLLGRFLRFLRYPYYTVNVETDHQGMIDILRLYALALVIVLPLGVLSSQVASNIETSNKVLELAQTISIGQIIFLAVILAPLWEEVVFRLPLRYTPFNVAFPLGLGMMFTLSILIENEVLPKMAGLLLTVGGLGFSALLYFWLKQQDSRKIHAFYEKWIGWLFYGLALAFGLIHIGNFTSLGSQAWLLAPILVLPQTVLGLFLGFIRLRHGFWWAVLTHGFHNACALTPLLLMRLGSENLLKNLSSEDQASSLEGLVGTDYVLVALMTVFVFGGLLLCLVTVWKLIAEWRTEQRQTA